jgi:hypothetical protein
VKVVADESVDKQSTGSASMDTRFCMLRNLIPVSMMRLFSCGVASQTRSC